jgi:uncharacterized protein
MRFWDSSALVPLLIHERESEFCAAAYGTDREILIWTLTKVEVFSALCRRMRDKTLDDKIFETARIRMVDLFDTVYEVTALDRVKDRAMRLLRVHPLRAADALQLAAVLVATKEKVDRLPVMCLDDRLTEAAKLEGFEVNP